MRAKCRSPPLWAKMIFSAWAWVTPRVRIAVGICSVFVATASPDVEVVRDTTVEGPTATTGTLDSRVRVNGFRVVGSSPFITIATVAPGETKPATRSGSPSWTDMATVPGAKLSPLVAPACPTAGDDLLAGEDRHR